MLASKRLEKLHERFKKYIDKTSSPNGCWLWKGATFPSGYGVIQYRNFSWRVHRLVWTVLRSPIPEGKLVCHNCPGGDNPLCCNPAHLWLGNYRQNAHDRDKKGRTAKGDRSGARLHPERIARGDKSGSRLHPESRPRGDNHWSRRHPEKVTRGNEHHVHLHPELMRGELNGNAKLTSREVRVIRSLYRLGGFTKVEIGRMIGGVSDEVVRKIVNRQTWKHVI